MWRHNKASVTLCWIVWTEQRLLRPCITVSTIVVGFCFGAAKKRRTIQHHDVCLCERLFWGLLRRAEVFLSCVIIGQATGEQASEHCHRALVNWALATCSVDQSVPRASCKRQERRTIRPLNLILQSLIAALSRHAQLGSLFVFLSTWRLQPLAKSGLSYQSCRRVEFCS